ncbi:helix-turn-helix domain-containing protein, partial [Patescibacteria group bacterium]|nr:helix-turn-helix domain-containing protein [Patescibacteria group bacterium]
MEELQEKKNEFWLKYLQIPIEVLMNKNLTDADMKLFALIEILDGDEGCFARNEYMASILNVSTTTISTGISKLKKLRYLKQTSFNGRYRTIKIDSTYKQTYEQSLSLLKYRIKAGLKHKNIKEDNNINSKKSSSKEEDLDFQESQSFQPSSKRPSINISEAEISRNNRPTKDCAPEPIQKGLLSYGSASPEACRIIDHWNGLVTTPTHKLNSKGVQ